MRRRHFAHCAPRCPVCAPREVSPLLLGAVSAETADEVLAGTLVCAAATCRAEFPIIDGIPIILAELRRLLGERAIELLLRDDLPDDLLSLLGDAIGPDTWFDAMRQTVSTYVWDAYADLDPAEAPAGEGAPLPGAARRCLAALLAMLAPDEVGRARFVLDLGCGAGRTSFELALAAPDALVLGVDTNLALLRVAGGAGRGGAVRYGRRRIGLAYDARRFATPMTGADRVDFWACDAAALPIAPGLADAAVALNLLDCVPDPVDFLHAAASMVRTGGALLLATPFDWAARATPPVGWIGGHSQRGPGAGSAEPLLAALLEAGGHERAVPGARLVATAEAAWQTRLHDRAFVRYQTHLVTARIGCTA